MPETFDIAEANPGSGGAKLCGDSFTQSSQTVFLPACYLVFGSAGGPYERVETGSGLPVTVGNASFAVAGVVAEDAPLSGNPVRQGMRARRAIPTSVSADDDIVTPWADREGRQVVKQQAGTATVTSVNDSASNVTLLAANTQRLGATVYNDSTAVLYLKLGSSAGTTSYTLQMVAGSYYEVPFGFTGQIDGIWASDSSGAARITEIT